MLIDNQIDLSKDDGRDGSEDEGGKGPFTAKEWKFLENYILEKRSLISSMKLAGYENYSDRWLITLGKRIVIRYEGWVGSAQKVFRQAGVGEVRLARTVDKLLRDNSSRVKLGACELAAKVLRASQEPEVSSSGVKININIIQGPCAGPGAPPLIQVDQDKVTGIPTPIKALQITK